MTILNSSAPLGEVSGAFLLGMLDSFSKTHVIESEQIDFPVENLLADAWYPYDYLIKLNTLIEESTPAASSILFWAGVKFIELWYQHGPGKEMVTSSLDWVYCNDKGGGYSSVVRGAQVGWCRNIVTNVQQGFALVENVMPISASYLRGIFFGGFCLFDDMAYYNTEIESVSNDPKLPFQRTVVKLIFKTANGSIPKSRIASFGIPDNEASVQTREEADDLLWRYRHQLNLSKLRDEYNASILDLANSAFNNLQALKEELATANVALALEATTDPLTGLNNRRYFDREITRTLNSARRNQHSVCVMMFDIDYFKQYNDHYGHLLGDSAIKAVAECIKASVSRESDLVARLGGEEFIAVITNSDEAGSRKIARRISEAIEAKRIPHDKSGISPYLTVSVGSVMLEDHAAPADVLLRLADDALYEAKKLGRNRHVHTRFIPA